MHIMAMRFWQTTPRITGGAVALAMAVAGSVSFAADWKPEKNVELVVGSAAGGPLDATARIVQRYAELRNIGVPVTVQNRTGGAQAIAMTYVSQHAGEGHYLAMVLPNLLTNRITGTHPLTYSDVTPLAMLSQEYIAVSVKADSPIRTARELIERLKAAPDALSFAITGRAGGQHMAAGMIMSAAGVDLRKLKFVSFKGGAEAVPAVLGGHVDILMATPSSAWKHVQGGQLRMLAITAPQRYAGERASVPTWKELGIDAVMGNWRGVVGPRGLPAAQVAYWDRFFSEMAKSAEWQEALAKYQWDSFHLSAAETVKFLQEEYKTLASLLRELGDAK